MSRLRLPKSGGDPNFGLGRSYYYEGEKRGSLEISAHPRARKNARRNARHRSMPLQVCTFTDGGPRMTALQVAKEECANCDSAGNCAGIGIRDDLVFIGSAVRARVGSRQMQRAR